MRETLKITSRDNQRLVQARKVRDGKVPDRIFLEGARLAEEAIRSDANLLECFFIPEFVTKERGNVLLDELDKRNIPMVEIPEALFRSIADTVSSQGIALTADRPATGLDRIEASLAKAEAALLVFLQETNDPSNLGALFRTAEAADVNGIILSAGSADPFSPKALRAAMGANLRLPIWEQTKLSDCVRRLRERGIGVIASDARGDRTYSEVDWKQPSLVIFGSEAHGLDERALGLADEVVRIQMKAGVESLNLTVSAGIILFEAVRQRGL